MAIGSGELTERQLNRSRVPVMALLAAQGVSITGNMLTMVAIPWFVLQTTGSPVKTGIAAFFAALPVLISGPLGGVIVDRIGHRQASMISDLVSGFTVALVPILFLAWGLDFWQLLTLIFLGALLDIPGSTARAALLPELAEQADISIERISSAADGVSRVARMIGAPLAGILIAGLGATNVLFVTAGTFVVSAALVTWLVPSPISSESAAGSEGFISDLKNGINFIAKQPLLRAIILLTMATNFLDHATFAVVMPVYADEVFGSAFELGLLLGAFGIGAVGGTIAYGAIGKKLPKHATFAIAFIIIGGPRYFLLAAEPGLIPLLIAMAVIGVAAGALNPIMLVAQYENIPPHMRGRVFGLLKAVSWGAMPLGALAAGFVVDWIGVTHTLITIGVLYLLVTLAPIVFPVWKQMNSVQHQSEQEAPRP